MKINISAELDLDDAECKILRELFDSENEQLADVLKPYVAAAAREYVDMFTGVGPISSVTDVRERRLVSIIRYGLQNIPPASLVARLFRIPFGSASNLIRTVSATHEVKIGPTVRSALQKIVHSAKATEKDGKPEVVINDAGQVRYLNDLIKQSADGQTLIKLKDGSANRYEMDVTTRTYLLERLK